MKASVNPSTANSLIGDSMHENNPSGMVESASTESGSKMAAEHIDVKLAADADVSQSQDDMSDLSEKTEEDSDKESTWEATKLNFARFFSMPNQLFIILLLEALNSYRNFGLRFVQYQYFTNEFGLSDTECGSLLGLKATLDVVFGMMGSLGIDAFGVRWTAIISLGMAIIGRYLLAFGRTQEELYVANLFFSPFGEAFLSVGLYKVALKKLTTPRIRPLAFAIQYAIFNFAGALCNVVIDYLRAEEDIEFLGHQYTGLRRFVVSTWFAVVISFVIVIFFVKDQEISHPDDPEPEEEGALKPETNATVHSEDGVEMTAPSTINGQEAATKPESPAIRRVEPPEQAAEDDKSFIFMRMWRWRQKELARLTITPTKPRGTGAMSNLGTVMKERGLLGAMGVAVRDCWVELKTVCKLRSLWRVVLFSFATFFVAKQWVEMETVLPTFLERQYGENVQIYTIISINLWGCMFLPPLVASITSQFETFTVMMPGLLIMAVSPIFLVFSPTVNSSILWITFLTLGEVFWSPRQQSWSMELAPSGREGVFVAVSSLKDLVITWPSHIFIGWLNERFNPNCRDCRDDVGHFCDTPMTNGTCASTTASCLDIPAFPNEELLPGGCPSTCMECPGYEGHPFALWMTVLAFSLVSPVLIFVLLPFLKGTQSNPIWCCLGRKLPSHSAQYSSRGGASTSVASDAGEKFEEARDAQAKAANGV